MLFLLEEEIAPTFQLLLAVDNHLAAEVLDCVVKVLLGKDDTGAGRQRLDLRAAIAKLSKELLHESEFVDHIEVLVGVDSVVKGRRKLLERVDAELDLRLRKREAARQGGILGVQCLD